MRAIAAALIAVTLVRLAMAAVVPLAPDETYYWVWSHVIAAGYVDHPPMVALWIRAGTELAGETAFGVRLLGPLAAALASWAIFDAGRVLFPRTEAGVAAMTLLNASLLVGVGTVIMTPDSPLLFFWTGTLWALARVAARGGGLWWLVAGFFGGLALDSKYTALFLWIGAGLWVLLVPAVRPWLRRFEPWAACAIGLLLFSPVLVWNVAHGWAGFVRQGGRVAEWRPSRAFGLLAEFVGGQIGLVTPVIWGLCMVGFAIAVRQTWRLRDPGWSLLAAMSLPPLLLFVQHAFGDRVQGNWPAIVYPALVIAAGGSITTARWWVGASVVGFAITALVYAQAVWGLVPLPPRFDPIAMRIAGWDKLARQVSDESVNSAFVAAEGYGAASELAWWMPAHIAVVGTDERWTLTKLPVAPIAGMAGLLVRDARRNDPPDGAVWTNVQWLESAARPGAGGAEFAIYRVTALGEALRAVELPRR